MKATFNGELIAESDETIYLEGNHYFPPGSVDERYLKPSAMKSLCFWKGLASYYTVEAGGRTSKHAAWTYRHPAALDPQDPEPRRLLGRGRGQALTRRTAGVSTPDPNPFALGLRPTRANGLLD